MVIKGAQILTDSPQAVVAALLARHQYEFQMRIGFTSSSAGEARGTCSAADF